MALAAGAKRVALLASSVATAGVVTTAGFSLFPFLLPSSTHPDESLTVWDASSSQTTLLWMLGWTIVFVPIVLTYTSWAFWVMRGKVSAERIESDEHAY